MFGAFFALRGALLRDSIEPFPQMADARADYSAVGFDLGFARSLRSDAAELF